MKRVFVFILLSAFSLSLAGCSGREPANMNVNMTDAPTPQETPLPEFTDPNEALAVGTKLFDDGKTEMAIEAFNQAVKLNPDLAEAYFKLGIAHALVESMAKNNAAPMEVTVTETDTNTNKKGEKAPPKTDSEKAFTKAVAAYKKMIDQNPKDDAAYYNLGRAYNKLNEDEDSAKALKQAVKLKPEDSEYQTELGAILIKLAQYYEAVIALKKAVELDPDNLTAQDLLEDAEAGLRRVQYQNPKKDDDKKPEKGASPSPTPEGSPDGSNPPPPPTPSGTKPPVKPTVKPPAKPASEHVH
jgi:tetratricopeptide (TPR) repeat protein